MKAALKDPALLKRLDEVGVQVVPESLQTPDGLRNHLRAEVERWGALIRKAGTYAD
jgi:tripartite-type tricarboxylate transporter receptor subunit TctC